MAKKRTNPSQRPTSPDRLGPSGLPAVSVVITVRNAVGTLGATLNSVEAQTFRDWEAIVVDDRSTDDSAHLAEAMSHRDQRFRLLRGLGEGMTAARNLGAENARAKILAFLDAGDIWAPDKLARHLRLLDKHPTIGLSFDRVRMLTPQGRRTWEYSSANVRHLNAAQLLCELPVPTASALVVRRRVWDKLGGFDETLPTSDMQELVLRLRSQSTWQVEGLARQLTYYRVNPNVVGNLETQHRNWQRLLHKVETYAPGLVVRTLSQAQAHHLNRLARHAARTRQPRQGYNLFKQALASDPPTFWLYPRRILGTLGLLAFSAALSWLPGARR